MRIREAGSADIGVLEQLSKQNNVIHAEREPGYFRAVTEVFSPAHWQEYIEAPDYAVLVAEIAGQVHGFALMQYRTEPGSTQLQGKQLAYIMNLCVAEQARGKGLGRQLFQACETWGKERGADELALMVWAFNTGARQLYESLGMRTTYHHMRKPL